jgi:transketolase
MRDIFIAQLVKEAIKRPNIMLVTGDLGFGVMNDYRKKVPKQFINAGLSEQNMTGLAAGMAKEGKNVFTWSIGNFSTLRVLEQLRIDVAYHDLNVTAISIGGGFSYGQLGMTHHATEDLATIRAMPNMQVFSPCDDWEITEIAKKLAKGIGPSYLRIDKTTAGNTRKKGEKFELGKIRTIKNGKDITLIATGGVLVEALKASEKLEENGIKARILAVHSLKPFDKKAVIKAAKETGGIITIEEHVIQGGLGGVVAETLADAGLATNFKRLGLDNEFSVVVGDQEYLRKEYGLDAGTIVRTVKKMVNKK